MGQYNKGRVSFWEKLFGKQNNIGTYNKNSEKRGFVETKVYGSKSIVRKPIKELSKIVVESRIDLIPDVNDIKIDDVDDIEVETIDDIDQAANVSRTLYGISRENKAEDKNFDKDSYIFSGTSTKLGADKQNNPKSTYGESSGYGGSGYKDSKEEILVETYKEKVSEADTESILEGTVENISDSKESTKKETYGFGSTTYVSKTKIPKPENKKPTDFLEWGGSYATTDKKKEKNQEKLNNKQDIYATDNKKDNKKVANSAQDDLSQRLDELLNKHNVNPKEVKKKKKNDNINIITIIIVGVISFSGIIGAVICALYGFFRLTQSKQTEGIFIILVAIIAALIKNVA